MPVPAKPESQRHTPEGPGLSPSCADASTGSPEFIASGNPAERALAWLGWADKDYVAARRLLLKAYLPQGAALANTALEKYFKALLQLAGMKVPRSHDVTALHASLLASFPNLNEINRTFLAVLCKAYELRYPDDLEPGFSIRLAQARILVELDRSVHRIRQGFKFERASGKQVGLGMDRRIEKGSDADLMDKNCYFGEADRQTVFQQLLDCYEMRVVAKDCILETSYQVTACPDDGEFPLEGLRPGIQGE